MFFELVGTVMAGLAAALFVYALRRWRPGIPSWILPAAAGAAMLSAAVSSEYGWYGRISAQLPEQFVVAQRVEETAPWRPWTYLAPFTTRFVAVDTSSVRTNPAVEGQRMVDLWFFGRWSPNRKLTVLWDCAGNRSAIVDDGAVFGPAGEVTNAGWEEIAPDDPVFLAACAEA